MDEKERKAFEGDAFAQCAMGDDYFFEAFDADIEYKDVFIIRITSSFVSNCCSSSKQKILNRTFILASKLPLLVNIIKKYISYFSTLFSSGFQ